MTSISTGYYPSLKAEGNQENDPFKMEMRNFRSSVEGAPVNQVTPTVTVGVTAVTFSVTKYVAITLASFC